MRVDGSARDGAPRGDGVGVAWASEPRPPRGVTLTVAQVDVLRSGLWLAFRGVALARVTAGAATAVAVCVWVDGRLALLLVALLGVHGAVSLRDLARVRGGVIAGAPRSTGYDARGQFVIVGSATSVLPRGWARRAVRDEDCVKLYPRRVRAGAIVVLADLLTVDDEDYLLGNPSRTGPPRQVVVDDPLRAAVRCHGLRGLASAPMAVTIAVLIAVDVALFQNASWQWQLLLTTCSVILLVGLAAAVICGLAFLAYPNGRVLRSFAVDDVLYLQAGPLLARTALVQAVESAPHRGPLACSDIGGIRRTFPAALAPSPVGPRRTE